MKKVLTTATGRPCGELLFLPALGMATARDLRGGKEHVVALCGDAAFTCGITYEALNNVSSHAKRLVVILKR